jgi:tetratricopeptide (TPR) repeat protein
MSSKKEDQKVEQPVQEIVEKESAFESFIEDPLEQAEDVYTKYKKVINAVGTAVLVAVVAFAGWKYYVSTQEEEASTQMFQAVYYFEADSLNRALQGDGNYPGLLEIADSYGMTKSGNLASFYVGVIYLKQGKFEDAISYLNDFSSSDLLIQARAYSLIGDANMELKQYEEAASYYQKAAGYKPNKEFTPTYLLKLALAHEKANNLDGALAAYQSILDSYPASTASNDAKRGKGYVESLQGK